MRPASQTRDHAGPGDGYNKIQIKLGDRGHEYKPKIEQDSRTLEAGPGSSPPLVVDINTVTQSAQGVGEHPQCARGKGIKVNATVF